jgi:hypothetical protein
MKTVMIVIIAALVLTMIALANAQTAPGAEVVVDGVTIGNGIVATDPDAGSLIVQPKPGDTLFTVTNKLSDKDAPKMIFTLGFGGCLRGPLAFFDLDGKPTFQLAAHVYYPTGCGGSSK